MSQGCPITVVIRTRDVESRFPELLFRLSSQTLRCSELVIVDNFSTKRKLEEMRCLLLSAKRKLFNDSISVKLVPLTDKEFSHPYSTNVGIFVASSDFVCVVNGHSLPSSATWLEAGLDHLKDPMIAAVCGYFASHDDGTVWEKLIYNWWWKRRSEMSKAFLKDTYFSTVNGMLRKSLWKDYPFDERLPIKIPDSKQFGGEDYDWAEEMKARGYRVIVEPRFSVYHSHKEAFSQLLQKYLVWVRIRKEIKSLKRPRHSYTKLERIKPLWQNI